MLKPKPVGPRCSNTRRSLEEQNFDEKRQCIAVSLTMEGLLDRHSSLVNDVHSLVELSCRLDLDNQLDGQLRELLLHLLRMHVE